MPSRRALGARRLAAAAMPRAADSRRLEAAAAASGGARTRSSRSSTRPRRTNFAQEMALGAKAAADDTPGVKLTECRARRGQRAASRCSSSRPRRAPSKDGVAMMTLTPDLFIRPLQTAASQNVPLVAVDVAAAQGHRGRGQAPDRQLQRRDRRRTWPRRCSPKIPEDAKGEILIGTDTPGLPVLEQRNAGLQGGHAEGAPGRDVPRSSTPSRARPTTSTPGARRSRRTRTRSPTSARAARPRSRSSRIQRKRGRARSCSSAPATSTRWRCEGVTRRLRRRR